MRRRNGSSRPLGEDGAVVTMKAKVLLAMLWIAAAGLGTQAQAQTPSADDTNRRAIERRAVEAVIWGMPAVNTDLMYQAMLRLGGKPNQIVYWSGLLDWRNQTLTPNPDVIYFLAFFNTKDGPVVIEIPRADDGVINGSIMDPWQAALEDVGPAGADKGSGGKYLITPPGYQANAPDGYILLPCGNYQGYALLRSILKSGSEADVKTAVAYGKRIRIYPLSQAANPPETVFIDAIGAVYDSTIPYDLRFFQSLDRFVQQEPWLTRDKAMIDQLKAIGIEKRKLFSPDDEEHFECGGRRSPCVARSEIRNDLHALLRRAPMGDSTLARAYQGSSDPICRSRQLSRRQPRRRLRHGVLQSQAVGHRPVLSDDDQGQGRAELYWCKHLSPDHPAECAGQAILVGDGL